MEASSGTVALAATTAATAPSSTTAPSSSATTAPLSSTVAPSSTTAGKRALELDGASAQPYSQKPKSWFGAAGDGGREVDVGALLKKADTASVVSSLKSKLSKPKDGLVAKPKLAATKTALTEAERLREQQRHREKAEATGKPVPYYRKA